MACFLNIVYMNKIKTTYISYSIMKKTILIIALIFGAFTTNAQNWNTDYKKSLEQASKENKDIVLVFSGSDWCMLCKRLDKKIFQNEEFKNYADKNWVLLKADFPKRKQNQLSKEQQEQNNMLAEKYHGKFPLIVKLNSKGEVLGRIGYKNISAKEYVKALASF